jgi:hypothetical protein
MRGEVNQDTPLGDRKIISTRSSLVARLGVHPGVALVKRSDSGWAVDGSADRSEREWKRGGEEEEVGRRKRDT